MLTTSGQAQSLAGQINSSGPRFVTVDDNADRLRQTGPGLRAHLSLARPRGIELVTDLLDTMGVGQPAIVRWVADQAERCGLPEQKSGPSSEAA